MANERQSSALDGIVKEVQRQGAKGPPPVHLWNPPFCGDLDMRIATDGTWFYLKTPIGRPALVVLPLLRRAQQRADDVHDHEHREDEEGREIFHGDGRSELFSGGRGRADRLEHVTGERQAVGA